jgi:hypothetical protein
LERKRKGGDVKVKKVIEGKLFDTEKATRVAGYSYGEAGDFDRMEQELYVTRQGNWFLAGDGGPSSAYSRQVARNRWSGSEDIKAMSADDALGWLEEHNKSDAIEAHFSDKVIEA